MAITKIHPIKSTLKKAIDYIVDPAKTDDKLLVSSFGCAVETADLEFEKTRLLAMQKGNNLAHHLIQAFEPGEVSYAQAHEIGRQLADEILGGKYEYVIAKQLLAEAGYPDGFYLRIDARNDSDVNADQVSQAIASYLEKVGIKAEVNLLPRASFYEKTSAENLQSSFFMAGWGDSSGEGMVIFNDMLYTYDGKPGMGEGNRGHYSNAEVDALLDQASVEPDQAKRAALVEQVDQIARDEAAYIPLFFKHNIFGVRAGIQYTPSCDDHILAWDFTF